MENKFIKYESERKNVLERVVVPFSVRQCNQCSFVHLHIVFETWYTKNLPRVLKDRKNDHRIPI